uniref:Dynein regulatory complex protein 12 n=1 Tax=Apteryx owenii TaxID=8824 RepID=A0A8B9QC73_APTOW
MSVINTGRGDRGRDVPACRSHQLAISFSAQEGAYFSRGKTSARGLRSLPHAKLRAGFHSPTLTRRRAMARQHQELQEQTASRSCSLEAEVKSLRVQLAARLRESRQAQEMAAQALAEKDVTIAQLQGRLNAMEMEYEKILHGSLDLVLAKLAGASQRWEEMGTTISLEHKECLKKFGLNPLEIQRPGDPQDRTGPCLPLPSDVPYPLPTTPAPLGQARGQKQQVQSGLGTHH